MSRVGPPGEERNAATQRTTYQVTYILSSGAKGQTIYVVLSLAGFMGHPIYPRRGSADMSDTPPLLDDRRRFAPGHRVLGDTKRKLSYVDF